MKLESVMAYAIRLADPDVRLEFEDIFKLASLVEEVAELQGAGLVANPELDGRFRAAIRKAFAANGAFRQEIEHRPSAKRLVSEKLP